MPRKFVTLGIMSIVLIAFMKEAHEANWSLTLFYKKCVKSGQCENKAFGIMHLLRNGEVDAVH